LETVFGEVKIERAGYVAKGMESLHPMDADFIHVAEGTAELEAWVSKRLLAILKGRTAHVAAGMRRSATLHRLDDEARQRVDSCADYLLKYKKNMHYDQLSETGASLLSTSFRTSTPKNRLS